MNLTSTLEKIIQNKSTINKSGIFSICSANPYVLNACMKFAGQNKLPLLIEATCNQVNQYGGYMNLTPKGYVKYVETIARESGFPLLQLYLGGDHLGPSVWKNEFAVSAMEKSSILISQYIRAGFRKIHLDASMPCLDDPDFPTKETITEREAQLCKVAVKEVEAVGGTIDDLVFIVGTEVPTPGGSLQDEDYIEVSSVEETEDNIRCTKEIFKNNHLETAWDRTFAFVVQPGVEFSDTHIHAYNRMKAEKLSRLIMNYSNLVFEAHSTDYQSKACLQQMVEDHFAILKVGPALTFAFREALFALEEIEKELFGKNESNSLSNLKQKLDQVMISNPANWEKYYLGSSLNQAFKRKYSLLDRSRYYWALPEIVETVNTLIRHLSQEALPISLVSQFLPDQLSKIKEGKVRSHPLDLINERICDVVLGYAVACGYRIDG